MAISIVMPALEMGQETGKLVSWRKQEGDKIAKSDILFEVETDKAVLEVESLGDGILAGVTAREGEVVVVGKTIAWLVAPGEAPPADVAAPVTRSDVKAATTPDKATPAPSSQTGSSRISPKARRLAKENGIDLANIRGTGADGEILTSDIQSLIDAKSGSPAATQTEPAASAVPRPQSSVARLMAERTTQSWTTVPHFFLVRDVDASALVSSRKKLRGDIEKSNGAKLTHTDLLVALVARTLSKHPQMNASWIGDAVRENSNINIAVAMAVSGGVVAAVIPNADSKALSAIATQRIELTERARSGKLRPADISGGTFTISNLGMYHVDAFLAIITPPQAAILAVGAISDRVVAINGKAEVRPTMTLTLSSDHRVVDGAQAAQFLHDLAMAIEDPAKPLQ
jgi:pyruvate dehydrogenase E2 component (dihydrolipoamide acetyltransferase)